MPSPTQNFEGLARLDLCGGVQCGTGTPPDTNGEIGPDHYIQAVNSAYGIYSKAGALLASFTDNQLWTGDASSCSTLGRGDAVVVYDALADRWILSNFAFLSSGGISSPPYVQCIAVSKTPDPVAGGWWLYPIRMDDAAHPWLNDYSKFGIWSDCLYMSANGYSSSGSSGVFQGTMFASFSRADMYAGAALTSSIGYIANASTPFSLLPAHLGGQSGGLLPSGRANFFVSESQTGFSYEVRKFTAGPNCGAGGTLGSAVTVSHATYTDPGSTVVPQPGTATLLDTQGDRVMQKVQYRRVGSQESLWVAHTFRTSSTGPTGIQWAQINITGGGVATTPLQQQNYAPADTLYRFMPSLAVDRQGNMALGYSSSGATAPNYPSIAYSGRLVGDAANTLPQTETQLINGGGSQTGICGSGACGRWGDYSSMSVDPLDDCTFWMTNEYYPGPPDPNTVAWHTRIGSFKFPACTAANRSADLAITKTDGVTSVTPGSPVTYTLVVSNNGPFAVNGATVSDTVPPEITGVTWSCVASAGNSCPASGVGDIATSAVYLMTGGTATFTVQGTLSIGATGPLSNVATVAVPAGFSDPVASNNSATDTDNLLPPNIAKVFNPTALLVGQSGLLFITVTNPNAAFALSGIAFSDPLPAGVSVPNAVGPGCSGTLTINANVISVSGGALAAGARCDIPITVTGTQAQASAWTNTIASVTANEGGSNSTAATANITVSAAATTISVNASAASVVGQSFAITYALAVTAPGSGVPTGTVTVSDGVISCTGTLPATSCLLTGTAVGSTNFTATYNGSNNFTASTSAAVTHVVNKANTTTTITSDSPDPSVLGQAYSVFYSVVAVAPGAGTPTGTVSVSDGSASCVGTLPANSCVLTGPSVGAKSLTATYSGSSEFNASVSAMAGHQVNKASTSTTLISGTPDPTVVGEPYTVTYAVAVSAPGAGTPSGTVTVSDGLATCTGTLPATSCVLTSVSAGAKNLVATYNGSSELSASVSTALAHQVNRANSTTTITSVSPEPTVVGQAYSVTVSATVAAGAGTPTGSVTVSDGSASCVVALPFTSCQLTGASVGIKNLIATYAGDAAFNGSASAATGHTVNQAATSTAIVADSSNPSVVGQSYTISYAVAVVAPGGGTPTGTVSVSDGSASCTGTLPATSCALISTTVGAKNLSAIYNGDANFSGSISAAAAHQVNKASAAVTIGSVIPEPSVIGQPYGVNYAVVALLPGAGTPTGSVTISDGSASCVAALPATSCQLTSTSAGSKNLIATYAGDASFNGATSAATSHAVNKAATTTTIVSDAPDPSTAGQLYTVTYGVAVNAPGAGIASGTVTVTDGGATCTATLPATSCQLASTTTGAKTLTATYNGDANFLSSVSASAAHQVSGAITTLAIVSDLPNPSVVGQTYTVSYNLAFTATGVGSPSGTVVVSDGSATCTGTLPATSCELTSTAAGAKNLSAVYAGDATFASSVAAPATHQVNRAASTVAIVSDTPDPSVVSQPYRVNFSVSAVAPGAGATGGSVTVSDGTSSCVGTLPATHCLLTSTTSGTKSLTATYSGDSNFVGSVSSPATHVVVTLAEQSVLSVVRRGSGSGTVTSVDLSINCGATCANTYANGTTLTLSAAPDAGSIFTGWLGACTGMGACTLTIVSAKTVSATFAPSSIGARILDVDANNAYDALTDGVMVLRYLFGFNASAVAAGAIGSGAGRIDPTTNATYLDDIRPLLDIDGNGQVDALTDGLMILRHLLRLRGAALTTGAVAPDATRVVTSDIEPYLQSLTP